MYKKVEVYLQAEGCTGRLRCTCRLGHMYRLGEDMKAERCAYRLGMMYAETWKYV